MLLSGRFIPAGAGNRQSAPCRKGFFRGSSPLARGTGRRRWTGLFWRRFIPAGAGNRLQNHLTVRQGYGSSPLARGTVAAKFYDVESDRFIPAGAGNSRTSGRTTSSPAVHPRWRGEQRSRQFGCFLVRGSSPLARGTAATCATASTIERFIPAGAGNSELNQFLFSYAAVHPRWRGEQASTRHVLIFPAGSSPLARGTAAVGWTR